MKKVLITLACLILLAGIGYVLWGRYSSAPATSAHVSSRGLSEGEIRTEPRTPMSAAQAAKIQTTTLAPEVEAILNAKIAILETLVQDPSIIAAVRTQNAMPSPSITTITELDDAWLASTSTTPLKKQLLSNATAQSLNAFEQMHPELTKIFIADGRGLIVGESVLTSDYYQADEPWWVTAMQTGNAFHGNTEFDQSTNTTAISLYVPVLDPSTHAAIGVLKAVVGMKYIQSQL